jgi:hypothetical protein
MLQLNHEQKKERIKHSTALPTEYQGPASTEQITIATCRLDISTSAYDSDRTKQTPVYGNYAMVVSTLTALNTAIIMES